MDEFRLICLVEVTHRVRGIDRGGCDQVRGTLTEHDWLPTSADHSPSSGRQGMSTLRLESRTPADHVAGTLDDGERDTRLFANWHKFVNRRQSEVNGADVFIRDTHRSPSAVSLGPTAECVGF